MKSVSTLERDWEDVLDDSSENFRHEVQAANMLRALANPHRLKILKLLDQAPHNVMDLCERLSLRQSSASQHLARLRLDGIVAAERQGHHVVYSLQNARAREILAILDGRTTKPVKTKTSQKAREWRRLTGIAPRRALITRPGSEPVLPNFDPIGEVNVVATRLSTLHPERRGSPHRQPWDNRWNISHSSLSTASRSVRSMA